MNLQGSAAKTAETLQSQTQPGRENRFLFNGIAVVHGRQLNSACGASARSSKEIQQQIEHDLYYVENWSFLLDVKIILMTVLSRATYE
jgi:lipopolysaccharide/colanic/teichoic acid biosynthesis glycosyltransferase